MLPVLSSTLRIGIIGLGYVGLPLALAFAEKYEVVGFDIDAGRVHSLRAREDKTHQVSIAELENSRLQFSSNYEDLFLCQIYIVAVPTPVTADKKPDLRALLSASEVVGRVLKSGDIVIYESTVYPGCTEEDCVPVLERTSSLKFNEDFYCGYSPERISPGDPLRTLKDIIKVTSGSTSETAHRVSDLYSSIITAGVYMAPSIKIAEASKAVENAQRDINISFVNELALIFDKMQIDTTEVLAAASTKWNFLDFRPGLVGGHCIGVDPYYLSYKAESLGYKPRVILSGRDVNDAMASFVVSKSIKLMHGKKVSVERAQVLVLGITFKENCPDVRNSKVIDIIRELEKLDFRVDIFDPIADVEDVSNFYDLWLIGDIYQKKYQLIIHAVAHKEFAELDFQRLKSENAILFDARSVLSKKWVDGRL